MSEPVLCQCCQSIVGRPPTPAIYRWVHPQGLPTPLCVACCASWRKNAKDDPTLLPRRIEVVAR